MRTLIWTSTLLGLVVSGCVTGSVQCPPGTAPVGGGCVERGDARRPQPDGGELPGRDASTSDGGALPDASDECDPTALDAIDLDGSDENCDGVDGVRDAQWYVSPAGDDANVGSIDAPFLTLGRALRATPQRPIVVAIGTYDREPFAARDAWAAIRGSVAIHGGFDASDAWRRTSTRSILRVAAAGQELRFFDADCTLLLERVEIVGADADSAMDGESALALVLRADATAVRARALLRDSVVHSGRATPGRDGMNGDELGAALPGHVGTRGTPCVLDAAGACTASNIPPTPTMDAPGFCREPRAQGANGGASRTAGDASAAGRAGGGSIGDSDGLIGQSGRAGSGGADGVAPASAAGTISLGDDSASYVPADGASGAAGQAGEGGGGGGGGAYGVSISSAACTGSSSPEGPLALRATPPPPGGGGGSGGDGGCGGRGGEGGGGGGASIAIVARGIALTLERVRIETSAAGSGGDGGDGGAGGAGGAGGGASVRVCDIAETGASYNRLGYVGGPGGAGGPGGIGGSGAGGAGGPSIGVAVLEAATVERDGASTFALGPAGVGGASAGNRGPDGVRAEVRELTEM